MNRMRCFISRIAGALILVVFSGCSVQPGKEQAAPTAPRVEPSVKPAPAAVESPSVPPGPEMGPQSLARTMRPIEAISGQAPMVLVTAGEPRATIVIPDERGSEIVMNFGTPFKEDVREMAAKELANHVRRVTGATLPVVRSKDFTGGPAVYLGESEASKKAGFAADPTLPLEGFTVEVRDGSAAILGLDRTEYYVTGPNGERVREDLFDSNGTLFGVYDVLERWIGIRWYWPDEELGTIAPESRDLALPAVRYADWPLYTYRTLWPEGPSTIHWPDAGPDPRLHYKRWRYGLGDGFHVNHSYNFWKDLFQETHPEYFLMRADGTREFVYYNGQICFSEPGVLRQEIENIRNYYEKGDRRPWGKWAVWPHQSYIPVMPNDCNSRCFCGRCEKANAMRKDRDSEGSESELVHSYFVKLANEVAKRWPEKWLHPCVYSSYLLPPETIEKYPPNVRLTLCMQVGMSLLKEPAKFEVWKKRVDTYVKMCGGKPIYIWSYSNTPRATTRAPIISPNTTVAWRQANRRQIAGEFIDHEVGNNRTFALDHLDMYFWIRTMWSPDVNVRAALDEYYTLCYGPAAKPMKEFYDLLIDRWENVKWGLPGGAEGGAAGALPVDKLYKETYTTDVRDQLKALSAEARRLAPAGSLYARRLDFVLAGYEPFYEEGEAMDRLNRGGSIYYAEPGTPVVDGKLEDSCWRREGTRLVEAANGNMTPVDSRVWFTYDETALYVAARLAEPEMGRIVTNAKKQDDAVYQDDSVELFFCPNADAESYAQIVVNPEGVVFDGFKENIAFYSTAKNFKIQKAIVKHATGWDLEMRIPYTELGVTKFEPGSLRRINFLQNRGAPNLGQRDRGFYAFSPPFQQSNHNTKFFGSILFSGEERFREDFGPDAGKRWRAEVTHKEGYSNPEAYAKRVPGNGYVTLSARMSKSLHIAQLISDPTIRIPVRKGDLLELEYRGPMNGPIRVEVTYRLTTPDGKILFGWKPDNNVVVGTPMRRHVVDLFGDLFEGVTVGDEQAVLHDIRISLSSLPDSENALEAHLLRVSPFTASSVK